MSLYRFELHEYNPIIDAFERKFIIDDREILEYNFTQCDYPSTDSLEFTVKNIKKYNDYVPRTKAQFDKMNPLIIVKLLNEQVLWFSFIIGREFVQSVDNVYVTFTGVGFTWFHEHKLLNANTNYTQTGDIVDLPEDFGFYKGTGNINAHMSYMLSMYTNPRVITFGRLSTTPAPHRRFRGINEIICNSINTQSSTVRVEQNYLKETIDHVYSVFGVELVTKQKLRDDGKIDIFVSDPEYVDTNVIRKASQIIEDVQEQKSDINFVYGYGWGNNDVNVHENRNAYPTTLEKREDLQYIGRQNNDYITTAAQTTLRVAQKNLVKNIVKIQSDKFFVEIECGDLMFLNGTLYRVSKIQETNSIEGIAFDIEIEEVTNE